MTRRTMLDAVKALPRSPIYGIGVCRRGEEFVDFEIAWSDIERDDEWAYAELVASGVTANDHVLITATNHESPWFGPIVRALRKIGATYTPAETYNWDAARFVSVLQRMPISVVIGLCGETLGALTAQDTDLAELFSGVRLIWARPEAHAALVSANVDALPLALLGPALGLARPDAPDVLRVNGAEWRVEDVDGDLVVSSTEARSASITEMPTGLRGRVSTEGDIVSIRL